MSEATVEREFTVRSELGLHARRGPEADHSVSLAQEPNFFEVGIWLLIRPLPTFKKSTNQTLHCKNYSADTKHWKNTQDARLTADFVALSIPALVRPIVSGCGGTCQPAAPRSPPPRLPRV